MDVPIYLRFADCTMRRNGPRSGPRSGPADRWYVIEERGDQETAADDELGDEHWIQKSVHDRVRHLRLPQLDCDVGRAYFAVSKSRLFFVGGYTLRENEMGEGVNVGNGILHIDLQQSHPSWERCGKWGEELSFLCAAAVFDEGDSIYVATFDNSLRRFSCRNVEGGDIISLAPTPAYADNFRPQFSLAVTASRMLLYQLPAFDGQGSARLGSYNLDYNRWEKIIPIPATICPRSWGALKPLAFYRTVLVRDSFLIYFARFGAPPTVADCGPALYVYDIGGGKWLSKPVQGLPNDDSTLPHVETELPVVHASLMQVRRDVLKFALVWSMCGESDDDGCVSDQTEVHWTKFMLRIEENDNNPPTFHADCKSSGIYHGGHTVLANSRAG